MALLLRDFPIKRKLMVVILLTTSFALLLMVSALITYELFTFRRALAASTTVLAKIIGANSTAAIAFQNADDANEVLSALAAEDQVTAAAIYDRDGVLFARFPSDEPMERFPSTPGRDGHQFSESHLSMFQPIQQAGERLGTIYLQTDLKPMYARFMVYGGLLLSVGVCSILGALGLSARLQRGISEPVLELATMARAVSARQDYSVRAQKYGGDEIGELTDSFNQMLIRIGESNAALAASEERLRLALEGSRTGTWDWNLETNRMTWDDYMYPLYGVDRADFEQTLESGLKPVHPEDRERLEKEIRAALEKKRDLNSAFRIVRSDGGIRYMASRGRAFYDEKGRPIRMSGVSMDVTVSKQTEEALQAAKEAAESANQAKDNFLAILSHELRTPLTPVLATIALMQDEKDVSPNIVSNLETIRRNVEVEARLIDDLLDVTRIVRGKFELHRHVVDARPLVEHAMKNYCAIQAERKNLHLKLESTATHVHVLADASRLTQVFWNLLQNSCKFTPEDGNIGIRIFNESTTDDPADQPELIVEVTDNGIGIEADSLRRIFDAFEQGDRSRTRRFGGLGLGLAISRAIVELHGGTLTATSHGKNKGSTFTVRMGTVAPMIERVTPSSPPASLEPSAPVRTARILLVEDHADSARQLTLLLKRAGHKVTTASSISEANHVVNAAAKPGEPWGFDLMISDLGLPDGNGHELIRGLIARFPVRGIALSGYGMETDIQESLSAGFARHITKPLDWQELKVAIQEVLAEPAHAAAASLPQA